MPQYNNSKNMEVVKEMFYRLYNKEIYDNDLLQFSMSYLNYVGRKRNYITRVVSDELERWSSDVRSELRFTLQDVRWSNITRYIAFMTLGPLTAEGYIIYNELVNLKDTISQARSRILEAEFNIQRTLLTTFSDIRQAIAQERVRIEIRRSPMEIMSAVEKKERLADPYLVGLLAGKMPQDPPECSSTAINILLYMLAIRASKHRVRLWIDPFSLYWRLGISSRDIQFIRHYMRYYMRWLSIHEEIINSL